MAVCFAVLLSGLTLTGCLNDDNLIGENCYDEILNNGEAVSYTHLTLPTKCWV